MSIIKSLQWRYATKKFDATKNLPEAKLSVLKEAFNLTALSYGLQTLKMVVVKDKKLRERLVEVAFGQRQVADASHLLVLCIQSDINADDVEDHFQTVKEVRETPDEILEPFKAQLKSTIEKMPEAKKLDWASRQAYIALGNLMTVCAVEAIDSCPMEGFIPEKLDEVLHLNEKGLKSVLLLPVGYRAEDDMFSQLKKVRKPITETVVEI
ncbi:NAD(P)H-dependent oxidoreductase [uncultured Winogradskyella sp.]|uniref:NAD(P)H-dependent oxidoreductase n=1 Tax=uncultured Winogradskyella sp. TaxID=395353 RepID=UPI0035179455